MLVIRLVLYVIKCESHLRCLSYCYLNRNIFIRMPLGPLEFEARSGHRVHRQANIREVTMIIVDDENAIPMIPAREISKTILRTPCRLWSVFSGLLNPSCCSMLKFLENIRVQPGATIHQLPNFVFSCSHDERRHEVFVNKPSAFLDGVRKGNPLLPGEPLWNGI